LGLALVGVPEDQKIRYGAWTYTALGDVSDLGAVGTLGGARGGEGGEGGDGDGGETHLGGLGVVLEGRWLGCVE
jgi:hypothetical protein